MNRSIDEAFRTYQDTRSPEAIGYVYDRTAARLLLTAMHLLSTATEAEDAVQDTFLAALERPERWDRSRPLLPWLLGILANRIREARARGARVIDVDRLTAPESLEPADVAASDELARAVEDAIEHLPQPYRLVVVLRLRNGLSPADIAIALDRNPSTIRAQLMRGLQMLRTLLPAGFAAGALGSLTATRGLAAVREGLVGRAADLQRELRWHGVRVLALRAAGVVAGFAGAVAIVVLALSGDDGAPVPFGEALAWDIQSGPPTEELETTVRLEPAHDAERDEPVATRTLPGEFGSVHVRVVRAGAPVPGALVTADPLGDPPVALLQRRSSGAFGSYEIATPGRGVARTNRCVRTTGDDGTCELERLDAGTWLVRCAGRFRVVLVRSSESADAEIALEDDACSVRGLVLDAHGAPVVGAEIWVCDRRSSTWAEPLTTTDAHGRFEVVAADHSTVGARAPGAAPVAIVLGATGGRDRDVVLRLDWPGGALRGVVTDTDGRRLGAAKVLIGHACDSMGKPTEEPMPDATPFVIRAAGDGGFAVGGIAPGRVWVEARAPGFAGRGQVVEVGARDTTEVSLVLPRAVTVHGRLVDEAGAPRARAQVRVGEDGGFGAVAAITDGEGRYVLSGVAPGRFRIVARDFEGAAATAVLDAEAGASIEWSAVLDEAARSIVGTARLPGGAPLAHAWVFRRTGGVAPGAVVRTDAAGRFVLVVPETELEVFATVAVFDQNPVHADGKVREFPLAIARDVAVGTSDLVIQVPEDRLRYASIVGRIGGHTAGAWATLVDADLGWRRSLQRSALGPTGRFDSGPVPPGRYSITVATAPPCRFGPFELAAGARVDVGVLHAPRDEPVGGGAEVRMRELIFLHPHDGTPSSMLVVEFRDRADGLVLRRSVHPSWLGDWRVRVPLRLGEHAVIARTASGLRAEGEITVAADDEPLRAMLVEMRRE